MSCEQLLPWLLTNKEVLIRSQMNGSYRLNPVKRVEIPKDNGKIRTLCFGIFFTLQKCKYNF